MKRNGVKINTKLVITVVSVLSVGRVPNCLTSVVAHRLLRPSLGAHHTGRSPYTTRNEACTSLCGQLVRDSRRVKMRPLMPMRTVTMVMRMITTVLMMTTAAQ